MDCIDRMEALSGLKSVPGSFDKETVQRCIEIIESCRTIIDIQSPSAAEEKLPDIDLFVRVASFDTTMEAIAECSSTEIRHIAADNVMCDLLEALGCDRGVRIFRSMDKWYS